MGIDARKRMLKMWGRVDQVITFSTKLSVIIAIVFGMYQVCSQHTVETRKVAIELVNATREPGFLQAFSRLKGACEGAVVEDKQRLVDDLNHLIAVFDNIAILYLNDLADPEIIAESIEGKLMEFCGMLDTIEGFPGEERNNIDLLKKRLLKRKI